MKTVIRYVSNDDREHTTENAALKRDRLLHAIDRALLPLGPVNPKVESGEGWIQHNPAQVEKACRAMLELCMDEVQGWPELATKIKADPTNIGWFQSMLGRILSDNDSPLWEGSFRFRRMDKEFREHQQPYFAINGPDKHHVCIEDRR